MYLTYEEYTALGGTAPEADFPRLELLARKRLDYWTQNRITDPDDDIRLCMTLIIDAENADQTGEQDVSSFSNDGVSVSFAGAQTKEQKWSNVYNRIVEILPVELVSIIPGAVV